MNRTLEILAIFMILVWTGGCSGDGNDAEPGNRVATSGKQATGLDDVPAAVLSVARAARPDLRVYEAEYEVRDGREYYDLGGTLPDGSELELDMTLVDGTWTVVEVQRDIDSQDTPEAVLEALADALPGWRGERIIESDQGDGLVIYEFFGTDPNGESVKVEVKWEQGTATVLRDEWLH